MTMEDYHVLEMCGEGSFGKVYKGRKRFTGQTVALKFIQKHGKSEKELLKLRTEIRIQRALKHENIILMLDSFETDTDIVLVTEFAQGELFEILEDDQCLPEEEVQKIAKQLVKVISLSFPSQLYLVFSLSCSHFSHLCDQGAALPAPQPDHPPRYEATEHPGGRGRHRQALRLRVRAPHVRQDHGAHLDQGHSLVHGAGAGAGEALQGDR